MKLPEKSDETKNERTIKVTAIDQQEAVGGSGGMPFDSGCNISGLRKIYIRYGYFALGKKEYRSTIKRIQLEFGAPAHSNIVEPVFSGCRVSKCKVPSDCNEMTSSIFSLNGDSIRRIDVWSDGVIVNAIRFYLENGSMSQLYGIPVDETVPPTSFEAKNSGSKLVGVHGRFGGVIDRLGFTFASINNDSSDGVYPPFPQSNEGDSSWTNLSEDNDNDEEDE